MDCLDLVDVAAIVVVVLLFALILVVVWPLDRRDDMMHGDQPRLPQ